MAVELMDEMVPGQGFKYVNILQLAVEVGTLLRDEDQPKNKHISFKHKYKQVLHGAFPSTLRVFLSL